MSTEVLEAIAAAALEGATKGLEGFEFDSEPIVVVNVSWQKEDGTPFAVGTAVPSHCNGLLSDSLRQSAEEADAVYQGTGC